MFNQYLRLAFVFISLVLLLQIWQGYTSYQTFRGFHQQLSEKSVTTTAREIDLLIDATQRAVRVYTEEENETLVRLLKNQPQDNDIDRTLSGVKKHFPLHQTFLLADKNGDAQFYHDEGMIGKTCKKEIIKYSLNEFSANPIFIHQGPQPNTEHFDVLAPLHENGEKIGVLLVSFQIEALKRVLAHGEVANHRLLLVRKDDFSQIQLSGSGDILGTTSDDLNDPDKYTVYSANISNSVWRLKDVTDNKILDEELNRLIIQGALTIGVFFLVSWFMLKILRNQDVNNGMTRELLVAVENERRRIAMDMHDQVLSELSHIARKTHQLNQPDAPSRDMGVVQYALEKITNRIRSIINDLHPHFLDNLGTEAAILSYLNEHFSGELAPQWQVNIDSGVDKVLNQEQRFNLYKIILEAVNNIQKHAQCSHFSIDINLKNNTLYLKIEDNGKGFDSSSKYLGLGLSNIKARARLLHAQTYWSSPETSTGAQFSLVMKTNYE